MTSLTDFARLALAYCESVTSKAKRKENEAKKVHKSESEDFKSEVCM